MEKRENVKYTLQDWLNQVNGGYSILGYWNWVAEQIKQAKVVNIIGLCPDCKQPLRTKSL